MSRAKQRLAYSTVLILCERFPSVFAAEGKIEPRPLRIGIYEELVVAAPDHDPKALQLAMLSYTGAMRYQRCMIAGRPRIGLDGQMVDDIVTQDQADHAVFRIARAHQRWDAQREAKRAKLARQQPEARP